MTRCRMFTVELEHRVSSVDVDETWAMRPASKVKFV